MVYANPKAWVREHLWSTLKQINFVHNLPWLVIEDFNKISSKVDKVRGVSRTILLFKGLNGWILDYRMLDLGSLGLSILSLIVEWVMR